MNVQRASEREFILNIQISSEQNRKLVFLVFIYTLFHGDAYCCTISTVILIKYVSYAARMLWVESWIAVTWINVRIIIIIDTWYTLRICIKIGGSRACIHIRDTTFALFCSTLPCMYSALNRSIIRGSVDYILLQNATHLQFIPIQMALYLQFISYLIHKLSFLICRDHQCKGHTTFERRHHMRILAS